MPPFRPSEDRFWEKVKKTKTCWLWTAAKVKGYGWFHVSRSSTAIPAYRFSYEILRGAIPKGMELHHTCRNRACVNPWHLEAHTKATHPDFPANLNRVKTHCPKGHPYDEKNTYFHPRGCGNDGINRCCRLCATERSRIVNAKAKRWRHS